MERVRVNTEDIFATETLKGMLLSMDTRAGANCGACLKDALSLSFQYGIPVQFTHNDRMVVVDGKKILDELYTKHFTTEVKGINK